MDIYAGNEEVNRCVMKCIEVTYTALLPSSQAQGVTLKFVRLNVEGVYYHNEQALLVVFVLVWGALCCFLGSKCQRRSSFGGY